MQEKITGMVLAGAPVGEYDKRLVILTKEHGKISAFARGARRPKSSLVAACEPFTFGTFEVYRGHDSYTISSVEVTNYFAELRQDLEKIYMGMYFCEVADYFTRENLDARSMLKLLYQSLRALMVPSLTARLVRRIFELKVIAINGEAPRLFACFECGRKEDLFYFVKSENGMLCQGCYEKASIPAKSSFLLEGTTVYILQRIVASDVGKLYTFSVSEPVLKELERMISWYFGQHVDKEFPALQMFNSLEHFPV